MREFDLTWLEEPVSPPGDHVSRARVRREGGVPIAAGENAAGLHDFHRPVRGRRDRCRPAQRDQGRRPSAMLEVAAPARAFGARVAPHNAYFGSGFLASPHVNATIAPDAPRGFSSTSKRTCCMILWSRRTAR
jgi:D-galactarolactone cycloisomerase